ncbi:MAG: MraY family glycosyltransferase [Sandaracinaceae bacterium]|nr:MraY family glycosyltransferase [Sandaracinaceae bacterium]
MRASIGALIVALVVTVGLTPLVRWAARQLGAIDVPGGRRVHEREIPRMGGIAVVFGFFAPLILLAFTESSVAATFYASPLRVVGLGVGGILMALLGAWDDIRSVGAKKKLFVQFVAAVIAWLCGFRMEHLTLPFVGLVDLGIFGFFFTLIWIVGVINAINLIDGLDGLAAGISFFVCLTNFIVATINNNPLVMLLSAGMGGALLGFLLYNFNPATIFLGDSGSMFIGFVLATTSMMGASIQGSTTVAILVPLISLGIPIIDTLFAMVRRIVERRSIFSADRGHIHHRLLDLGFTHRRAVLVLYALSIFFTGAAIVVALGRNWQVGAALTVLTALMIGIVRFVGYFEYLQLRRRQKQHIHSRATERLRVAVPELIRKMEEAEPEELPEIFQAFAKNAELLSMSIVPSGESDILCIEPFEWNASEKYPIGARERVKASFPIPSARAKLKCSWLSDDGEVSPQADILLQLVADAIDRFAAARLLPRQSRSPAPLGSKPLVAQASLSDR